MQPKYTRWQTNHLHQAINKRRVVVLAGPRQCGKTTLVKLLIGPETIYRTLDDKTLLTAAITDPIGFVQHANELMIIDEVQKAPILLPAIKVDVDENQSYGRFLLTGSANIRSLPGVQESLAGRIKKIRLRSLAQGEIHGSQANFLQRVFARDFAAADPKDNKDKYIQTALIGGYPEAIRFENFDDTREWYADYIESLLERDIRDVFNIRRQDGMRNLLYTLAAWSSKYMDISAIGSGLALTRPTITAYINALETLYLIERLEPWTKTDYDRVGKQDKIFITDTGLMSALLGLNFASVRFDGDQNGKLIETFVFTQLAAQIDATPTPHKIYHYRDRYKREIDFLIESENGNDIIGIEVKAGSVITSDSFKHLRWFATNICNNQNFIGLVLYTGNNVVPFGQNMWAVPINFLWA